MALASSTTEQNMLKTRYWSEGRKLKKVLFGIGKCVSSLVYAKTLSFLESNEDAVPHLLRIVSRPRGALLLSPPGTDQLAAHRQLLDLLMSPLKSHDACYIMSGTSYCILELGQCRKAVFTTYNTAAVAEYKLNKLPLVVCSFPSPSNCPSLY